MQAQVDHWASIKTAKAGGRLGAAGAELVQRARMARAAAGHRGAAELVVTEGGAIEAERQVATVFPPAMSTFRLREQVPRKKPLP